VKYTSRMQNEGTEAVHVTPLRRIRYGTINYLRAAKS